MLFEIQIRIQKHQHEIELIDNRTFNIVIIVISFCNKTCLQAMARCLSSLFWAVQLVLILEESNGYVVDPRDSCGHTRGKSRRNLSASKKEGEKNETPKGKNKQKCPPYMRCPDYPSLALNDNLTKKVSLDNKRQRRTDSDEPLVSATEKLYDVLAPSSPLEFDFLISGVRDSNRRTRLLNRRSYTARAPFEQKNINEPPSLNDLKPPPSPYYEALWISVPFRIFSFAIPYYAFPYFILFLDNYVTMKPDQLADITSKFGPGVSILYGTFISLTLSILYGRQRDIQNDAAVEASLLALITRNLLNIFRCEEELSVEAGQTCADQIRILSKGSRGSELLAIMYSDPYARMLEIIEEWEFKIMEENSGELRGAGVASTNCRDLLESLFKLRANRLSDESLALPPTHFFIMSLLTGFILLGYAIVSKLLCYSSLLVTPTENSFLVLIIATFTPF